MGKKKNLRPHFRRGGAANENHPAAPFRRQDDDLFFVSITHSAEVNGVSTIPLNKNPNPADPADSFLMPEPGIANIKQFGSRYKGWAFDASDMGKVKKIMKKPPKRK
jgi:hypothetical protein